MTSRGYHVGVDIGGTKTAVGIFDRDFQPVCTETIPTRFQEGCSVLAGRIGETYRSLLLESKLSDWDILSAGAACPGPLDLKEGRIVFIPTMGFRNEPLKAYLEETLGLGVALENDTNAAALCESVLGQGKGCDMVAYVTVSTVVGCGLAYRGEIVDGHCFAAGELGHLKVERNGLPCPCGGRGCLEAYASGTSIAKIASQRTGRPMDAKEVFARAREGRRPEADVVREAADCLGYGIAALYQIVDPDIVVLGGSVTKDYEVFREDLEAAVRRYAQPLSGREYRITVSAYDGAQVLLGAAYYGAQQAGVLGRGRGDDPDDYHKL